MSQKIKDNIKEAVQLYIKHDDSIKAQEKQLRDLKKKRDSYSDSILGYMSEHNLSKSDIKVSNHTRLVYKETNTTETLSQGLLEKSIKSFFLEKFANMDSIKRDTLSKELYNYIIKSRKSKTKFTLKRTTI